MPCVIGLFFSLNFTNSTCLYACGYLCFICLLIVSVLAGLETAPSSNTAGGGVGSNDVRLEDAEAGDDDLPPENI